MTFFQYLRDPRFVKPWHVREFITRWRRERELYELLISYRIVKDDIEMIRRRSNDSIWTEHHTDHLHIKWMEISMAIDRVWLK